MPAPTKSSTAIIGFGSSNTPASNTAITAGTTTYGTGQAIGIGINFSVSIVAGATAPVGGATIIVRKSIDNSTWFEEYRQTVYPANSATVIVPIFAGIGGNGGDWPYIQIGVLNNDTGSNSINVAAPGSSTLS